MPTYLWRVRSTADTWYPTNSPLNHISTSTATTTITGTITGSTWWGSATTSTIVVACPDDIVILATPPEDVEARSRIRQARVRAASRRAEELLMEYLTPQQRLQYRMRRSFEVRGASGVLYELRKGWTANVAVINDRGRPSRLLCCHPNIQVPYEDNLITQLFMLRDPLAEREFNARANEHPLG